MRIINIYVRKFESLLDVINENLNESVRLDPKCWKGKKIGKPKTKMKGGVRVNNCVPKESIFIPAGDTENYFAKKLNPVIPRAEYGTELQSDFSNLPSAAPYGFWVDKEGKFVPTPSMGHDLVLVKVWPELKGKGAAQSVSLQTAALKSGLLKMAKLGQENAYGLTYHPLHTSRQAIKAANDIAKHYNMTVVDDFKMYGDEIVGGL